MTNFNCVNILDAIDQVLIKFTSFSFSQLLLGDYVIEELASLAVLHDEVELVFRIYDLKT